MIIKKHVTSARLVEPVDTNSDCQLSIYPLGDPQKHPGSYAVRIPRVHVDEFWRARDRLQMNGMPCCFAVRYVTEAKHPGFFLLLAPRTSQEFFARFEFNPPRKIL